MPITFVDFIFKENSKPSRLLLKGHLAVQSSPPPIPAPAPFKQMPQFPAKKPARKEVLVVLSKHLQCLVIRGQASGIISQGNTSSDHSVNQGRNWVISKGGVVGIYNRKDNNIHCLSPSIKCVAPLFKAMA